VDHVYLTEGIYDVKLTARLGENSDTQTCKLAVSRNYAHILEVREDQPQILSGLVAGYDLNLIPAESLPRVIQLYLTAEDPNAAVAVANKLAALRTHADPTATLAALTVLEEKLIAAGEADQAVAMWDRVPADSDLQPSAARHAAEMALWWTGDFAKAVKLLKPYANKGNEAGLRRQYGEAMVLAGQTEEGRKILEAQATQVPAGRKAALSGAAARSVEFFITTKDPEAGEEAWNRWQARFPTDFLEGYSVMLRTKLMELRKRDDAAAKLAEAFADAVPLSPYAPQLLDRASKLLAVVDPAKSRALHQLLKQKYPEDPLSQD
jgi:hypothetical protein